MDTMNINKKQWIGGGIVLVVVIIASLFINRSSNTTTMTNSDVATSTTTSVSTTKGTVTVANKKITEGTLIGKCNFFVTFPKVNQSITFPLTVIGYMDESKTTKCTWYENMTRAGNVQISYYTYGSWKNAGVPVPIMTNGSLGTAQSTSTLAFTVALNAQVVPLGIRSGTPIKLTFTELNSNTTTNTDSFTMNLQYK